MTRKIFSVFCFAVALFVSCGKETSTDEKEGSAILLCMTSEASGVTQTTAILNGSATIKNAKASNANAYFYYSTTQADAKTLKASGQRLSAGSLPNTGGDFSANLASLSPATTYYYVASVIVDDQEELGGVKSFTTEKKTDSFSVTGAAIDITVNSATLTAYANLPADMTGDVTIGIIYSTSSSPSLQNGKLLTSKDLDGNNMYQVEATGLTPDTKYYFKSFLSRSNLNYYGEVKEFTTAQVLASVSTLDAWDVAETKAMVGGKVEISSKGVLSKSAVIYYGTDGTSADALKTKGKKVTIEAIDEDGSFKAELTSLTASTKYYFIAVVTVEGVEFAGAIKNFTTQDKPTEISVTGESADIGESSAKLYGWCNQEGAEGTSVVFGIEYSATDLTTAATTITASDKDPENKYCCQATSLSSNTLYYYRAFTLFNGVRSYGEVKTFTTLDFTATATTLAATDITEFKATLNGSIQVESHDNLSRTVSFLYSDTAMTLEDLKTTGRVAYGTLAEDGSFKCVTPQNSELLYNTTYYYVACSKVHDKVFYGTIKSFTTKNIVATTLAATDVYYSVAVLNGSLSIDALDAYSKTVSFVYGEDNSFSDGRTISSSLQTDGSFRASISSLKPNTIYYYQTRAYVQNQLVLGETQSFKTLPLSTTGPNGAVALGVVITKSDGSQYELFWANKNLGASSPYDYGDYYAWGEIETKNDYSWETYRWGSFYSSFTKYNQTDNKTVLDPEDDIAHVALGGKWRMPTVEECNCLIRQCGWKWVTKNGVEGYEVTSRADGNTNSIFLPAAYYRGKSMDGNAVSGTYYSSSLKNKYSNYYEAYDLSFTSESISTDSYYCKGYRYLGHPIRPVCEE